MTLKEYRKSLGLSQTQLAEKLGVSYQAYQQWEQGKKQPGSAALINFVEKLQVTIRIRPGDKTYSIEL
jgi:transcriptional regulator with XRE-family HTH domain